MTPKDLRTKLSELGKGFRVRKCAQGKGRLVVVVPVEGDTVNIQLLNKVGAFLSGIGLRYAQDYPGAELLATSDAWTAFNGGCAVTVSPKAV